MNIDETNYLLWLKLNGNPVNATGELWATFLICLLGVIVHTILAVVIHQFFVFPVLLCLIGIFFYGTILLSKRAYDKKNKI
jgi:ABC-type Na+ efflux pump permease subunit